MRISVVINSKDSERTLGYALRSVADLADEIVVIDMESRDRTVAIAREHGAKLVSIQPRPIADTTRELAIGETDGDFVLMLDADELVPPALCDELRRIAETESADAVRIPMVNYLIGARLRGTSWSPHHDRHWRFFRPDAMEWPGAIHTMPRVARGRRGLELTYEPGRALVHFNYLDTSHFLGKLDRYTNLEAERLHASGSWAPVRGLVAMAREVGVRYLLRQGFRDGWRGLHVTLLMVIYRYLSHAKHWELERVGRREEIERRYANAAESWLAGESDL